MAAAIATVSLREGWWPECLQQEFLVCSAFLENEHTRLKLDGGESHRRSPAVPSFRGASMSARKSSLSEYGLSLIQDSPDATLDMKSGKWLAMDGTVRGLRDAFKAFQRGGVRSCEVSATYKTSDSPPNQTGVHYLNKTKVCTWAHSERDGNLIGNGYNAVRDYLFFHDVSGQVEVIEEVMCPHNDGSSSGLTSPSALMSQRAMKIKWLLIRRR